MLRGIGILSIFLAITAVYAMTALNSDMTQMAPEKKRMAVSYRTYQTQTVAQRVVGYGRVRARWQTHLSSEVNGRIQEISPQFLSGATMKKGDLMAVIDATNYQASLQQAKANLATAKRTLKEEQQRSKIAQNNWQKSGLAGSASDLVLRLPQLEEARVSIRSARAAITQAEYHLNRTRIVAPYDSTVVERVINPGDYVQVGSAIGTIYDHGLYEISVPLSESQLNKIQSSRSVLKIVLHDPKTAQSWLGNFSRLDPIINSNHHTRNAVIEITHTEGLLPGKYLRAEFILKRHSQVYQIPSTLLAADGYVWYIDQENHLQRFLPNIVFQQSDQLVIQSPGQSHQSIRIAQAQDSFLPQLKVIPINEL